MPAQGRLLVSPDHAIPRVSAILPAYNGEAFVGETLASLEAQTWHNLEIVIGDDASSDATPDILRAFAERRANVQLVLRERNLGWIGNTNDLMSRATGAFMFFAFHDDLVEPTYVERLARALMDDPGAVLAYSDMEQREPDGEAVILRWTALEGLGPLRRVQRMAERTRTWHVPNRGLFRSSAFRRIGGLKRHEQGEFAADLPWLTHMASLGRFVRVPEILCRKRYMAQSLTKVWRRGPDVLEAVLRSVDREILASDLGWAEKRALVLYLRARRRYPGATGRILSPVRALIRTLRRQPE
jgi:glycosyltransferase involved in cell wall biosynthesis